MNTHELAILVLRQIAKTPKGGVYASRKGVVAGARQQQGVIVTFRRVQQEIVLEIWSPRSFDEGNAGAFPGIAGCGRGDARRAVTRRIASAVVKVGWRTTRRTKPVRAGSA